VQPPGPWIQEIMHIHHISGSIYYSEVEDFCPIKLVMILTTKQGAGIEESVSNVHSSIYR